MIRGMVRHFRGLTVLVHQLLGWVVVVALWGHLVQEHSVYQWCLIGGMGVHVALTIVPWGMGLYQNMQYGHEWPRAHVESSHGILKIRIDVPRTWAIQPGQYIQLWC